MVDQDLVDILWQHEKKIEMLEHQMEKLRNIINTDVVQEASP